MKRYVATAEFYVWASSDEEATNQAKALCKQQDAKADNRCELVSLVEQPFGVLGNRPVKLSLTT